jgi:GPH family glycoside/pentoside/hexuronide:cation symporter
LACFGLALVGTISKWFCYTPENPYLIIGVVFFLGPANAGFRTFADSMIADVCEYEEARSGLRLEGMFGAVYSWALKTGLAIATFLSGWILVWAGFEISRGAAQSAGTLLWLRLLFAFFPFLALFGAAWWLRGYSLDAETMRAIHQRRAEKDS